VITESVATSALMGVECYRIQTLTRAQNTNNKRNVNWYALAKCTLMGIHWLTNIGKPIHYVSSLAVARFDGRDSLWQCFVLYRCVQSQVCNFTACV